jgi:autoinducer 2-degrading protein
VYVLVVDIKIKPERTEEFKAVTRLNHEGSVQEPGCLRFDVLQDAEDPTHFCLYEVYKDQAAVEAHRQSAHFAKWRDAAEGMMQQPRTRVFYNSVFPDPWK